MRAGKMVVLALVVMVVVAAFVVPLVGGAVAVGRPTVDSGPPVAAVCQSRAACGGVIVAVITPTPEPPPHIDPVCQGGAACGG